MKKRTRLLSVLLTLVMALTLLPTAALAADVNPSATIAAPTLGATVASVNATFAAGGSGYTVSVSQWHKGGTLASPGAVMADEDTFAAGNYYVISIIFTPASGNSLAGGAKINGVGGYNTGVNLNTGAETWRFGYTLNADGTGKWEIVAYPELPDGTPGSKSNPYAPATFAELKDIFENARMTKVYVKLTQDISPLPIEYYPTNELRLAAGEVILDLNGHNISAEEWWLNDHLFYVTGDSALTITGNGAITCIHSNDYGDKRIFDVDDYSYITIENGTFRDNRSVLKVHSNSEAVINGGSFSSAVEAGGRSYGGCLDIDGSTAVINGGTFVNEAQKCAVYAQDAQIDFNGGTFKTNKIGPYVDDTFWNSHSPIHLKGCSGKITNLTIACLPEYPYQGAISGLNGMTLAPETTITNAEFSDDANKLNFEDKMLPITITSPKYITNVAAALDAPATGAYPDATATTATEGAKVNQVTWYNASDLFTLHAGPFEAGQTYWAFVEMVVTNDNYAFAPLAELEPTVNDENATIWMRKARELTILMMFPSTRAASISGSIQYTSGAILGEPMGTYVKVEPTDATLSYQWQWQNGAAWENIDSEGAKSKPYVPTADMLGKSIRLVVTAEGYPGSVMGGAITVVKQSNLDTPNAPQLTAVDDGGGYTTMKINNYDDDQEYVYRTAQETNLFAIDWTTNAITSDTVTGLAAGTTYYVYTRFKETDTQRAGWSVKSGSVKMLAVAYLSRLHLEGYADYGDGNTIYLPINGTKTIPIAKDPIGANTWNNFTFGPSTSTTVYTVTSPTGGTVNNIDDMPGSITITAGDTAGSAFLYATYPGYTSQYYGSWNVVVYDPTDVSNSYLDVASHTVYDDIPLFKGATYTPAAPEVVLIPAEANEQYHYEWRVTTDWGISGPAYGQANDYISVNKDTGKVTALTAHGDAAPEWAKGVTLVAVKTSNPAQSSNVTGYNVTVSDLEIPLESVAVAPGTVTLAPGGSKELKAIITPENTTTAGTVAWSKESGSDNITLDIATGKVTAVSGAAKGDSAIIKAAYGGKTATATVKVDVASAAINSVDVSVDAPAPGAAPTTATPGAATYTVTSTAWTPNDAPFKLNKGYTVKVVVETSGENRFTSSTAFKINGQSANIDSFGPESATITLKFPGTYTATVSGSHATTTGAGDYVQGATVSIDAGTRSGYLFDGWTSDDVAFADANSAATTFTMPGCPATVTANWRLPSSGGDGGGATSYTLTFNANGGSAISSVSKASGTTVDLAAYKPTRDGYDFAGWYSDSALTTAVTSVKLTKNTTVYAKWTTKTTTPDFPFTDVPEDAYYKDAVEWAVDEGITQGTSATTFSPNGICTRAQMATFLWRAVGSPAPKTTAMPFADVAEGSYYYTAVLWAVENGITIGTSDTTFSPNENCSRGQMATFLYRFSKSPVVTGANPFSDVKNTDYYYDAVRWAANEGITQGTSATTFSPNDNCTRAQIVTFLYRLLGE